MCEKASLTNGWKVQRKIEFPFRSLLGLHEPKKALIDKVIAKGLVYILFRVCSVVS